MLAVADDIVGRVARAVDRHVHDPPDGRRWSSPARGVPMPRRAGVRRRRRRPARGRCRSWSAATREDFERARPVLRGAGQARSCTSAAPGAGQVVKACNQIVVALTIEAVSEALVLGSKAGVESGEDPRRARRRPGRQPRDGDAPAQLPRARLHARLPGGSAPQGPEHRARVGRRLRRRAPGHEPGPADAAHAARPGPRRGGPLRAADRHRGVGPSIASAAAKEEIACLA